MRTKEAIANRIIQLCNERNIAINELANLSGVAPSTVYSLLNEKSQNPGAVTIKKLCDGLEITLREFFNTTEFDNLEQEIQSSFSRQLSCRDFFRQTYKFLFRIFNHYTAFCCICQYYKMRFDIIFLKVIWGSYDDVQTNTRFTGRP